MTAVATTPLDLVDMAFLRRAEALLRPAVEPAGSTLPESPALPRGTTLVERLLGVVPEEWRSLAARVEQACASGISVIAVAGGCPGEGRSTVVACLARVLADRGHAVDIHDRPPLELPSASRRGRWSIALVDAGVWFPAGPIRRSWLAKRSLGCQSAILVRRADAPESAARGAALEAVGVVVLGEVLTMAPPATHAIHVA